MLNFLSYLNFFKFLISSKFYFHSKKGWYFILWWKRWCFTLKSSIAANSWMFLWWRNQRKLYADTFPACDRSFFPSIGYGTSTRVGSIWIGFRKKYCISSTTDVSNMRLKGESWIKSYLIFAVSLFETTSSLIVMVKLPLWLVINCHFHAFPFIWFSGSQSNIMIPAETSFSLILYPNAPGGIECLVISIVCSINMYKKFEQVTDIKYWKEVAQFHTIHCNSSRFLHTSFCLWDSQLEDLHPYAKGFVLKPFLKPHGCHRRCCQSDRDLLM